MKGVLPLNEFQSTSCLFLILKVEGRKHSSQSHQKVWCAGEQLTYQRQTDELNSKCQERKPIFRSLIITKIVNVTLHVKVVLPNKD